MMAVSSGERRQTTTAVSSGEGRYSMALSSLAPMEPFPSNGDIVVLYSIAGGSIPYEVGIPLSPQAPLSPKEELLCTSCRGSCMCSKANV